MAKDDTTPGGLFSKMVKFVRSPGTQWNDLDDPGTAKEGSLSKQALKEMIERKRRNDFVRKREFDMLRKLRRREVTGEAASDGAARPSFFQSSMPSRPDDRAITLKKIDEIEAQMSMQWWKTKHGAGVAASSLPPGSDFSASEINARTTGTNEGTKRPIPPASAAYARTAPDDLQNDLARSAAKQSLPFGQGASAMAATQPSQLPSRTPPSLGAGLPGAVAPPSRSIPAAVGAKFEPAIVDQAKANDMSLDFTADVPALKKAVIKVSPFSSAPVPQSPKPVDVPAEPRDVVATASATPKTVPAVTASGAQGKTAGLLGGLAASYDAAGSLSGFSASKVFALEVDDVQHDPELEEAAIRFANGDDEGAQAGLLEAVSAQGTRHNHDETWLTLFDLYRATGQNERFDSLAIDFASKFGRSSPMWFSIPEMVARLAGAEPAKTDGGRKPDWKCPAILGIQTLAALNALLPKAPMPWTLEWTALRSIDDAAVAPLAKLFLTWAKQPVQLRFSHTGPLEEVLRQGTPSGVRTVNQDRWNLLMAYLRVAHRPDEFELAALDFCVTYEVSPPSWESGRCEFKLIDAEGNSDVRHTIIGDTVHDSILSEMHTDINGAASMMSAQLASIELSGQIMGEPKPVLDKLEARLAGADVMIISCAKLVRVDFSAAGSLLNWVSARQAEGRIVQFTDVHRLVAAFFHVIGISEHAKVIARID